MEDHVRLGSVLQGRAEGGYQRGGDVGEEPDGVDVDAAEVWGEPAQVARHVQGCEQLVPRLQLTLAGQRLDAGVYILPDCWCSSQNLKFIDFFPFFSKIILLYVYFPHFPSSDFYFYIFPLLLMLTLSLYFPLNPLLSPLPPPLTRLW